MLDRVKALLDATSPGELAVIAGGALGQGPVREIRTRGIGEITKPHYDPRTIGVVRITGTAVCADGIARDWSAVSKTIDLAAPPVGNAFCRPDTEEAIYRRGLFSDGPFRAAGCYLVSRPADDLSVLWLEDLSDFPCAPFGLDEIARAARHLGEWNGRHIDAAPDLGFEPWRNSCLLRWRNTGFDQRLPELLALADHRYTKALYGESSLAIVAALYALTARLMTTTSVLDASLGFGDSNVGNLFVTRSETVAVDWASLTLDPLGVDAGCLIGSATTFGRHGTEVALAERDLFDTYFSALQASGYKGSREQVRRGYLCHYLIYAFYTALLPAFLVVPGKIFQKAFLEKRYQTAWDDIPALAAGIPALFPRYVEELQSLLG